MLDALPVAVVAVDGSGAPVHLNATALDLLAAPSGDPDRERLRAAIRLEGGEGEDVMHLALHVARPIGVPVTVVTNRGLLRRRALLARWGAGGIVAFRGLVAGSDAGAAENEAHLEALLANTADIITVLDPDGTIRYSNPAAGRLTGFDGAVVNGTQVLDLVHPEDRPRIDSAYAAALANPGIGEPVVLRLRFADGEWHVLEAVVNNLLDDPDVGGLVVTAHDVTEAAVGEQRFRSLIANLSDVIVLLDADLKVSYASPAIERLLGDPAESNVGSNALRDIHPDDTPRVAETLQAALRTPGEHLQTELRIRHHSGRWRRVLGSAVNLLDDPSVAGIVCTLRDVTEEREALDRLEELGRMKDQFLTTISHELRTPLTAINGFVEVLRTSPDLDEARRDELLDRVARNGRDLQTMVDRLLDHARVMAGDVPLSLGAVDVRGAVDDALDAMAWALREHELSVVVAPGLVVGADPDALGHVLRNLLGNAAKFSPPGSRITVTATAEGPEVTVAVADQGPGVPGELADRIFEPFFQVEPGISRRGTGVGLSIARRYTELQGGRIGMRSGDAGGSTFWVSLPSAAT